MRLKMETQVKGLTVRPWRSKRRKWLMHEATKLKGLIYLRENKHNDTTKQLVLKVAAQSKIKVPMALSRQFRKERPKQRVDTWPPHGG